MTNREKNSRIVHIQIGNGLIPMLVREAKRSRKKRNAVKNVLCDGFGMSRETANKILRGEAIFQKSVVNPKNFIVLDPKMKRMVFRIKKEELRGNGFANVGR